MRLIAERVAKPAASGTEYPPRHHGRQVAGLRHRECKRTDSTYGLQVHETSSFVATGKIAGPLWFDHSTSEEKGPRPPSVRSPRFRDSRRVVRTALLTQRRLLDCSRAVEQFHDPLFAVLDGITSVQCVALLHFAPLRLCAKVGFTLRRHRNDAIPYARDPNARPVQRQMITNISALSASIKALRIGRCALTR